VHTPASPKSYEGLLERLGQPRFDYGVNMARWPDTMKQAFVELGPDPTLFEFLERAATERASPGKTWLQRMMRLALSDYDANALLGIYPMHLFGTAQAEQFLMRPRGGRLLDIGAGSGDVTAALRPLFETVEVVETSWAARRRLRARGYVCWSYDVAESGIRGDRYDVIALLNVLDRVECPVTLLARCRARMTDETRLLLSVPLPYRPLVYRGAHSREPKQRLAVVGSNFSDAVLRLVQQVLLPNDFEVERLTRLPYLSGGDSERAITALDAAVVLCKRASSEHARVQREL
jgi:hypothetical protein